MKLAEPKRPESNNNRPGAPEARAAGDWVLARPGAFWRVVDRLLRDPELRVCLVEPSWDRVDAARVRAREAGVDDRLVVHHAGALQLARAS